MQWKESTGTTPDAFQMTASGTTNAEVGKNLNKIHRIMTIDMPSQGGHSLKHQIHNFINNVDISPRYLSCWFHLYSKLESGWHSATCRSRL